MSASANSAGDVKQAVEGTFDELYTHVEHALGIKIPTYLKNILWYSGFDNRVSLHSLRERDIAYLETFAQSEAYYGIRQFSVPTSSYYGKLCSLMNRETFTIPLGHKRLLIAMIAHFQVTRKHV